ncbi:adenylate/guanylate cyclase domain-containing protein [Hymenobacter amundsenii]|uniref:Adenylate/guanylate cyclase domain-containing protein n=1 Tax=Hymenobacter amundsenii TaxID=2006685 RepID=A0A246FPE4_9BACT|nr:adenylate/guanylate cyclase domain-containing protein [Hymenobacter amundsenii]OWP64623.1 adenylate/guanylate cyclase domain-containing protein [Hymenobacter amundsenii]
MSLSTELKKTVAEYFATKWVTRNGQVVPEADKVTLGNDAVKLNGVVLYADLAESTNLVRNYSSEIAAEVYKSYLHCASKIIRNNGGVITAFDGDRVMAVYIGENKETRAMRTALALNSAVIDIINPALSKEYGDKVKGLVIKQAVGIDVSDLFIAKTGVRGANDLVWVGNAANHAAKLCGLRTSNYASWVTKAVYDVAANSVKKSTPDSKDMWESSTWEGRTVYRSYWRWDQ